MCGVGRVTINWLRPREDGGSPITSYEVGRSTDESSWLDLTGTDDIDAKVCGNCGPKNGLTRSLVVDSLDEKTKYFFRVRAVNTVGRGDWSEAISCTTIDAMRPGAVDALSFKLPATLRREH